MTSTGGGFGTGRETDAPPLGARRRSRRCGRRRSRTSEPRGARSAARAGAARAAAARPAPPWAAPTRPRPGPLGADAEAAESGGGIRRRQRRGRRRGRHGRRLRSGSSGGTPLRLTEAGQLQLDLRRGTGRELRSHLERDGRRFRFGCEPPRAQRLQHRLRVGRIALADRGLPPPSRPAGGSRPPRPSPAPWPRAGSPATRPGAARVCPASRVMSGSFNANVIGTVSRTGTGLPSTLVTSYSHWRAAVSAASSKGGTLRSTSAVSTLPVASMTSSRMTMPRWPAACASSGNTGETKRVRLGAGTSRPATFTSGARRSGARPARAWARDGGRGRLLERHRVRRGRGHRCGDQDGSGVSHSALRPRPGPRRRAPPWRWR
jgi:hypothetical protein